MREYKVKNEDIFSDDLVACFPELFDSKRHSEGYINTFYMSGMGMLTTENCRWING